MIVPIGHDQSIRRMPWVTISIVALCTLMQLYATLGAPSEEQLVSDVIALHDRYTDMATENEDGQLTPEQAQELERQEEAIANKLPAYRFGYKTHEGLQMGLFTSAFVHGGWMHLIGNMLFLWLAGSALEDRYGRMRFALFYLLGSAASAFAYDITAKTGDPQLLVGASGAISACMGAFLIHFRKTEITFWYLLMYRSGTFRWPASLALPLWLAEQFIYSFLHSSMGMTSQVAYASHIGGFAVGMAGGYAMSKLFPHDADHDDIEYSEPAPVARKEIDAALDERITKCLAALKARDQATVRQLSSRVILDLARVDHDGRILELYREIEKQFTTIPLTDGAFAAAATAADRLDDRRTFVAIAGAMKEAHPGSTQLPRVMWRLSEIHREAGEHELEQETLRTLAQRFTKDPLGQKAKLELERQR